MLGVVEGVKDTIQDLQAGMASSQRVAKEDGIGRAVLATLHGAVGGVADNHSVTPANPGTFIN